MSQALHIFRKDLRRLRWWLALWVVLQAVQTVLAMDGPRLALSEESLEIVIGQVVSLTATVVILTLALLVSRLIHDEPLVGLDWYWISRPYDWRSLLAAKLVFAVVFFVAVPLAAHVIVMAAFGAGLADMIRVAPGFIVSDLRWALIWMVFAVLTRSLPTFSLAVVGAMISMVLLLVVVMSALVLSNAPGQTAPDTTAPIADASGAIVVGLVFIGGALGVIVIAYKERRRPLSLLATGVSLVALVAVPMAWPWRFAAEWPEALDWRSGPSARVEAVLDLDVPPRLETSEWSRRNRTDRTVQIPTRLVNLPPDLRIQSTFASSRLVFADGHVLQTTQSGGDGIGTAATSEHPLQRLFPGSRVLPIRPDALTVHFAGLIRASDDELGRYGSQPGRLTSTLSFNLLRSRIVAVLPLRNLASYRDGSLRVDLLGIERRRAGCAVLLRRWRALALWSPAPYRIYESVLRNRRLQQVVVGDERNAEFMESPLSLPFFLFGMSAGFHEQGSFAVAHTLVQFPARQDREPMERLLEASWLADADLVVIESTPVGWLTRKVTVDGFRMQPAASVVESRP